MIKQCALFFACFALTSLSAQPRIAWQKSLGGSGDDQVRCAIPSSDGGWFLTGYTKSTDGIFSAKRTNSDLFALKLDADGNVLWVKTFGGSGADWGYSAVQTADGGYALAGTTASKDGDIHGNHGGYDIWILCLDSAGNLLWSKVFGGTGTDYGLCINQVAAPGGGLIVSGSSDSNDGDITGAHGGNDMFVIRLNSAGEVLWKRTLGGSSSDRGWNILALDNGTFLLAGDSNYADGDMKGKDDFGGQDGIAALLDGNGNIVWLNRYGDRNLNEFRFARHVSNGFILSGATLSPYGYDYWVCKIDFGGKLLWSNAWGGTGSDYVRCLITTADGSSLSSGLCNSRDGDVTGAHGDMDAWVIKLDSEGQLVWQKNLGGSKHDDVFGIQPARDGGFLVASNSNSVDGDLTDPIGDYDIWLVKLGNEFPPATLEQPIYNPADTMLAKRYLEEAKTLITSAKFEAALKKLNIAELIFKGTAGKNNLIYAELLHEKGKCFYSLLNYNRACDYYRKSLEIQLIILGSDNLEVSDSYNNLGLAFYMKGDCDRAIEYYHNSLKIRLNKLNPEHQNLTQSYYNLGLAYFYKGDYNHTIEYHQKALKIRLNISMSDNLDLIIPYNQLANAYYAKNDYTRAYEYFQKTLEIQLKKFGPEHLDVSYSYTGLAFVFGIKGDFDRGFKYIQKALEIQLNKLGPKNPVVATSYSHLGLAYYYQGSFERSIEYHQKALETRVSIFGPKDLNVAPSYIGLGNAYFGKRDYNRAIKYYQEALGIQLNELGAEHADVANSYNWLGLAYYRSGEYNRATEYLQKALKIWLDKLGPDHPYISQPLVNLSLAYGKSNRFDEGEPYIAKSLKSLHYELPSDLNRVTSLIFLIEALRAKTDFYKFWYAYSAQRRHLHAIRQSCTETSAAIAWQRRHLEDSDSKSTLAKNTTDIYESGIAANRLLYQLTDSIQYLYEAFQYAEQSKALNLYESMKNADALHLSGIPDSLLRKEYDLRLNIADNEKYRQNLYTLGNTDADSAVLHISGKLFDLNHAYEGLIRTFETRYPDYYRLKYDLKAEDVPGIQCDLLQPRQAMLMYHVGDSNIFIFLIKKDDYHVIEIKKDFPLEDWVRQLRHGIYGFHADTLQTPALYESTATEYIGVARQLYKKLLAPVDSLLPKQVIIIPDGVLGYVPFEALLMEQPGQHWDRFQEHAYFWKKHDISYCYSATLLREMKQKQHKKEPEASLAAFAPFYKSSYQQVEDVSGKVVSKTLNPRASRVSVISRHDFKPLPQSGEEVAAVAKIWNGRVLVGADAREAKFNETAGEYRMLHLATHGQADSRAGDYSYLAFAQVPDSIENELLYVREIYNLALNADLVTLSACETGIGELQRGEGVISLARAFSYAGAKSIVTSLWSVDDAKTKDLMVFFYQNLKNGMSKDEALAQARRDFLMNYKGPNAHPYFWAGFVAIGDMRAIGQ